MTYQRKTRDEYQLWVNYGQGWEHEISEDTRAELNQRYREYRENCPEYPLKRVSKRVRIGSEYKEGTK